MKDLFTKISNDYYSVVTPAFMEFNNTFFEKVYKAHLKDYVSVPTELQTRLRYIQNMEEYQLNEIIENINTILISYINNQIKDALQKAKNTVVNYLDYFHINAQKSTYGYSGNNKVYVI